jgi:signal transduction histidine kinase
MTLRRKLALRYASIVGVCLLLVVGLAYHEFVTEPLERKALGIPELPEAEWGEFAEVFFYGMIPLVLGIGWWLMRRTLNPLKELARGVERIHAGNLREPLSHSGKGDEVDRLTEVFNAMTARLDQSFQQIREFTLHASHELKTPLTVMRAGLETHLRDAGALAPGQPEWAQAQLDEVQRLARIVDSLTLLTKADAGLITLERQPVPLADLMRECFEDAQILAEPHGVTVTLAACEPLEISGDRHRLRQLLLNLTDNAVKYNQAGGRVMLALRRADGLAEIEVANTGPGISPELQARVFERFVRGTEARNRAADGCGLGLAICQWIVQAHGGTIGISTDAARLTTVRVRLPLRTE